MIRQFPIIPTILVLAACAVMVSLGIWQLGRAEQKAKLIAQYETALLEEEAVPFPHGGTGEEFWFRRSSLVCERAGENEPVAGTASSGAKGWAMSATCFGGDTATRVDLGFSRDLVPLEWEGGPVTGLIAPGPRLIADPPQAGLQPLAKPDPQDLPNNHLAYAGQWFFFALTALLIYLLAVRGRLKRKPE